jgi:hypothetical protein
MSPSDFAPPTVRLLLGARSAPAVACVGLASELPRLEALTTTGPSVGPASSSSSCPEREADIYACLIRYLRTLEDELNRGTKLGYMKRTAMASLPKNRRPPPPQPSYVSPSAPRESSSTTTTAPQEPPKSTATSTPNPDANDAGSRRSQSQGAEPRSTNAEPKAEETEPEERKAAEPSASPQHTETSPADPASGADPAPPSTEPRDNNTTTATGAPPAAASLDHDDQAPTGSAEKEVDDTTGAAGPTTAE